MVRYEITNIDIYCALKTRCTAATMGKEYAHIIVNNHEQEKIKVSLNAHIHKWPHKSYRTVRNAIEK